VSVCMCECVYLCSFLCVFLCVCLFICVCCLHPANGHTQSGHPSNHNCITHPISTCTYTVALHVRVMLPFSPAWVLRYLVPYVGEHQLLPFYSSYHALAGRGYQAPLSRAQRARMGRLATSCCGTALLRLSPSHKHACLH